jgi:predicted RNase H-like nuclease
MDAKQRQCVGVDGARHGWLAVWEQGEALAWVVYDNPTALCSAHRDATVIAVDIPIGLSDHGPRAPDVAARRFVGGKRASSVFSAPVRAIIDSTTQPEASRRHRAIDGRGFGAQAFAILPKIRIWDGLLTADAELQARVYEIHPEVSFAALNGGIGLAERKKSAGGAATRMALLGRDFGSERVQALVAGCPRRLAATDDVLDALVALWTAQRIAAGTAVSLPSPPQMDSAGLRTAIHY